ncbi:MAG: cell surface protein SprA [Thermoflavifilum sp.]|nr:cell surface protein SprA [Thermoflavifilum sp.]
MSKHQPKYVTICWMLLMITLGSRARLALAHHASESVLLPNKSYTHFVNDTTPVDSLPPWAKLQDSHISLLPDSSSPTLDLHDPTNIQKVVEYDPLTRQYVLMEKIGNQYYRFPTTLSFDQFYELESRQQENRYWMQHSLLLDQLNRTDSTPTLYRGAKLFNRIFGGTEANIRPQGNIDLTFGYQGQNYQNLTLPERARKTGGFDFNMNINMNVLGQIGSKLKITTNYNTQSVYDFEKQVRLEYTGDDDQIIRKIEAGNVSFPLRSSLITGVQSLFGIKTQLQFGRLSVTTILSNQRSQKQTITIHNGSQTRTFGIHADQYMENQHFLLAQYFHDHFAEAMSDLPVVKSQVYITRIEVWVTNKSGATTNAREVVGLMDLGEYQPFNPNIHSLTNLPLPQNDANDEYANIVNNPAARNSTTVITALQALGLQPVQDFEKTYARKLDSTEYTVNRQLGYISLNRPLQPDEVLAVAFQYTYNGKVYQVGEFSQDVPPDPNTANPKILFLKLLKATSAQPRLPIWQLMMKNIYAIGDYQINRDNFVLNIYYQDPGGGEKRYLPDAQGSYQGAPLLSILNLDRLNNQNDPQPDGQFDFLPGYTINPQKGWIIFPELQPFGKDLLKAFPNDPSVASKYLYQQLYDSTKTIAEQFPQYNRYVIRGTYQSSSSSDIFLGAFNIPPGSVTVTAGGQILTENVDYTIDYSLGRLKIINQAILNSGVPINVQFENNALYGQQSRNYAGIRFDYTVNDKLTLGATVVHMGERPYFTNVSYGEDPISNTIVGLDANYRAELPGLTHWLDRLPHYATTTPSYINATGEVARLFPGHSKLINYNGQGTVFIDDFEGAVSGYDLKFPYNSWALASTPVDATDSTGRVLFPEATLTDSLPYGYNRAKIAWYTIEQSLVDGGPGTPSYLKENKDLLSDLYIRPVFQKEVFPNRTTDFGQSYINTFDLAYFPTERGPYNYVTSPSQLTPDGHLLNPASRWGGIMRALDITDFEAANIAYVEFWVLDPFLNNPNSKGGYLYINLGDVSEDIQKDGKLFFENGLPYPPDLNKVDSSVWGYVPRYPVQITNAFDNDPAARPYQDVGYDGLSDDEEKRYYQAYLNQLLANFGPNSAVYQHALRDPSNDDYHYYRGADYDAEKLSVVDRYKDFNNPDGNSPVSQGKSLYSTAATNYPETEDLNHDNTLNETEQYYQYRIHLVPNMQVGQNFIVDKQTTTVQLYNGKQATETWYEFRIPIRQYDHKVGNISDFRSIRFMRMFLTGFTDSVILRFATLQLVRDQWRQYNYSLQYPNVPIDTLNGTTQFTISAVNIEENASRYPIPYVSPPGVQRQQLISTNNVNLLSNEQSLSLKVINLQDGDARAVFKDLGGMDMRRYKTLRMFVHAEAADNPNSLHNGDVQLIIRLGSDFVSNYYEYRIPLQITPWGSTSPLTIWPDSNDVALDLAALTQLKQQRNLSGAPVNIPFTQVDSYGRVMAVVGNPNLGQVTEAMIGILNPKKDSLNSRDDGLPKSVEVWCDEMRLSDLDEHGGYAAVGRVDLQLADLGTVSISGSMHTVGFGSVDQSVNERFLDNYHQFNAATSLQLGKLLPQHWGLVLPVYAGYSQEVSNPEYDPYDLDIRLKDKLKTAPTRTARDSILAQAQTFTSIKTINFTNVRIMQPGHQVRFPWDIQNFDISYSFNQTLNHNPLIQGDLLNRHRFGLGYTYNGQERFFTPFQHWLHGKSRYLSWLRDFNFNPIPALIGFRADINRQYEMIRIRNIGGDPYGIPPIYNKYFTFDRYYNLQWDLTHSLNLNFSAINNARIDEPAGALDTKAKQDTVWQNFLRLGRTTMYSHTATLSYTLPLNKFPILDWINARAAYSASYQWIAASRLAMSYGNNLNNAMQRQLNMEMDFNRLYNKWKFLRLINQPALPNSDSSQSLAASPFLKALLKPLLSVKRISINYNETGATSLPGYLDSTKILGQNLNPLVPGLPFAFGYQPDSSWLNHFAARGLLSRDTTFNIQYQQNFTQQLNVQASLEPYRDLRIDLLMTQSFSKTHTELFKDTSSNTPFVHLNPYDAGGFQISFIALKTLFAPINNVTGISQTFLHFERYRAIISQRLGKLNPYTHGQPNPQDPAYTLGYGRYAQDVLIPAFLAAYTGKDPNSIGLLKTSNTNIRSNPFSRYFPRPNWQLSYTGLSRLPFLKNVFSNVVITHAYSGLLSMNSFTSNLFYEDPLHIGYPGFIDTVSGNYIPYFAVPNITIQEQLAPLIGVDMTFTNGYNVNIQWKKSRTLSLSLIDYQLTEMRSSEIDFSSSFRIRKFSIPGLVDKNGQKITNDLNFRIDLAFRNDKTANNLLDANQVIPTSGQKVIRISPSIDYVVNNRLNLHFFYDRQQTIPVISTAYPITNTQAGLTLRFVLQ